MTARRTPPPGTPVITPRIRELLENGKTTFELEKNVMRCLLCGELSAKKDDVARRRCSSCGVNHRDVERAFHTTKFLAEKKAARKR
jgi:ribosomal protein L37E